MKKFALAAAAVMVFLGGGSAAYFLTDAALPSFSTCEQAVTKLLQAKRIVAATGSYRKDNPTEYTAVRAYLEGGSRPTGSLTRMGAGLVALEDTCRDFSPPPTTTTTTTTTEPPPTTTVPPPPSTYPDASNTGVPAGVTLTVVNGDLNVSTAGQVIDGRDVRGCIILQAAGITVRNSKAECIIIDTTASLNGARHTFVDSEIRCDPSGWATGIRFGNFNALRLDISNCENGMDISRNVSLRDSYIHDLYQGNGSDDPHSDGIQGEVRDSVIEHNTIYAFTGTVQGTSAIIASGSTGGNMLIRNNLMAGGAYTLYCPRASGVPSFQVVNNRFSTISSPKVGAFGPSDDCADETLSGNVYHETGQPLSLP